MTARPFPSRLHNPTFDPGAFTGGYVAYDRSAPWLFFGPPTTLLDCWRAVRGVGMVAIARISPGGDFRVIYRRGLGWDEHVSSGRPVTYR